MEKYGCDFETGEGIECVGSIAGDDGGDGDGDGDSGDGDGDDE